MQRSGSPASGRIHRRGDNRVRHREARSRQGRKRSARCRWRNRSIADRRARRRKAGALTLRGAVHQAWPMNQGHPRRIGLTNKVSADGNETCVRGCEPAIGRYRHGADDLAEPCHARGGLALQHDIRLAGEIATDQNVRPLKAVWSSPGPGAALDLHIAADRDIALEQRRDAADGHDVSTDGRWFECRR